MTNNTRRGIQSLFSLILALALCSVGMAAAATTVEIDPTTQSVGNAGTFTVRIDITPDTAIGGAQADLTFNPDLVQVTGISNGGMFPNFGAGTLDNAAGTITGMYGYFTSGGTTTTSGTFVEIEFVSDATNTGTSPLNMFNVKVTDGSGAEKPSDPQGGSVAVGAGTLVEVAPPTQTVCSDDTFTATIDITPAMAIGGAQADLTFNPNLVQVTGISNGGMFPNFGAGTLDNAAGTITGMYGYFTSGGTTTTSGTFVEIEFVSDATNTGTSPLNMFNVKVTDGSGDEQLSTPANGEVIVEAPTTYYHDADGDGYGDPADSTEVCGDAPDDYVTDNTDCDDNDNTIYPGATELCDGKDNDCVDGVPANEADADGDGVRICGGDCNDGDATVWQLLTGYTDADSDGYGTGAAQQVCSGASLPSEYATQDGDCDDTKAAVNPGANEVCGNGIDDNCDGQIDEGCCACDFCYDLEAGWNFVSVPNTLNGSNDANTVFNLTLGETCLYYDCVDGWKSNGAVNVVPCQGYWVGKVASDQICLDFDPGTGMSDKPEQDLCQGWNMIGHIHTSTMPVDDGSITDFGSITTLEGEFAQIWQWTQSGGWECYPLDDGFTDMTPGQGYWILTTGATTMYGTK